MKTRNAKVGKIERCQICSSSNIKEIISLGFSGLCVSLLTSDGLNNFEKSFPLNLLRCKNCQLLQLDYIVDNKEVFHLEYPY